MDWLAAATRRTSRRRLRGRTTRCLVQQKNWSSWSATAWSRTGSSRPCVDRGLRRQWRINVLAEEPRAPTTGSRSPPTSPAATPRTSRSATRAPWRRRLSGCAREHRRAIDREAARCDGGGRESLRRARAGHRLVAVRAAGPGRDLPGCFVYRTIDDLDALRRRVDRPRARPTGRVRGASSAAGCSAWRPRARCGRSGVDTHVVEIAPRLMPLQVDEGGGALLRRLIEGLGVACAPGRAPRKRQGRRGTARLAMALPTGELDADVVVFAAGIRPRDELARAAGLAVGERGGVVVDDTAGPPTRGRLGDRRGRLHRGPVYGLVAPGLRDGRGGRRPAARRRRDLPGRRHCPPSSSCSASTWPASATRSPSAGARSTSSTPTRSPASTRSSCSPTTPDPARRHPGRRRLGVHRRCGRWSAAAAGRDPVALTCCPRAARRRPGPCPTTAQVCSCNNGDQGRSASRSPSRAAPTSPAVKACTKAGTSCGSCVPMLKKLLTRARRRRRGQQGAVRALRRTAGRSCSTSSGCRHPHLLRAHRRARHRPRLRHLQAGRRLDPGLAGQRPHPRRRAGRAAGHQRPLPGQPAEGRHLLGGARGSPAARSPRGG